MSSNGKLIGAGMLTAFAASLCCITPVIALVAGSSGLASTFSWLEPMRPYFIGCTILVIGFAWYQKLKPQKKMDCNCETEEKPKFIHSKKFLFIVTILATLLLTFPYYANIFYPQTGNKNFVVNEKTVLEKNFKIDGMTCASCEDHVNHEVNKLKGIIESKVSYEKGNAVIKFDSTLISAKEIEESINLTGYTVTHIEN